MAGTTIPLISKRTYSFTSDAIVVVAKAVNVVNWTSGLLVVRVHSTSVSAGTLTVKAYKTAPSAEEPSVDFVDPTAVASASVVAATLAGELVNDNLTADFGGYLRIVVDADWVSGTLEAEISAELVLKD